MDASSLYNMVQKPTLGGGDGAVRVENAEVIIVNRSIDFLRHQFETLRAGGGGEYNFTKHVIQPFIVRTVALFDPPPVGKVDMSAIWKLTECGWHARGRDTMLPVPFLKISGQDAYVPLDAHVKLAFVAPGGGEVGRTGGRTGRRTKGAAKENRQHGVSPATAAA